MENINLDVNALDVDKVTKLNTYIDSLSDPEGSLINVLHRAQHIFGYIPTNLQLYIARKIGIGAAKVNGVVSFYSYFTEEKMGKYVISTCLGTACYVKGSEKILHKILEELDVEKNAITKDGLFTVRDVRCVGACGLAPIVTVGEKVFAHVTEDDVLDILNEFRGENK